MRLLAFLLLLAGLPIHAQMYKCVDARGVTQYSDKPCPDGKGKEVDIRGQPPISGKLQTRKEDSGRDERDFQRRQIQRDRQQESEARQLAQQKQRCENLRSQLRRASAARRPPDATAHDARIKALSDEIAQKCR